MATAERYAVVHGSQSSHCCFSWTIVDMTQPVMIHGKHWQDQYEPLCECFNEQDADLICVALNMFAESK
jgi:hypothetical protein